MFTLKYRLVGELSNPTLSKDFASQQDAKDWAEAQGNVLIYNIYLNPSEDEDC